MIESGSPLARSSTYWVMRRLSPGSGDKAGGEEEPQDGGVQVI